MKVRKIPIKKLFVVLVVGEFLSMIAVTALMYHLIGKMEVLLCSIIFIVIAIVWLFVLTLVFSKRLSLFTTDLCRTLDDMISGGEIDLPDDSDTLLARIQHRLSRLYGILRTNERKLDNQRRELQELVSDISHQVKTPMSNLKMVTDTLLTKQVTGVERMEFLYGIQEQTDKLGFLMDALVKTSRLETGIIHLEKQDTFLYNTLAQAMSGIVYGTELKNITVSVNCPEDLHFFHDSKWTAEALFNILDNAVKYTLSGGEIKVSAEQWEMSVRIQVTDTGKGIPADHQVAIFQRFYREDDVHNEPGVGIGLYLAREIISRQGGYITVASKVGKGSTFTIMLPLYDGTKYPRNVTF